jgi:pimeloyl-ACP methyl ester carboxylesterase
MAHAAWSAVIPHLRWTRRIIAFDTAGFGATLPLPQGTPPTVVNLVKALARSIHQIGIETPVDIAGNSLGGSMALEAANQRIARSVVAISRNAHGAVSRFRITPRVDRTAGPGPRADVDAVGVSQLILEGTR